MSWVFLSHSSSDKQFAWRLAEALASYDVEVWVDEAELRVGESLVGRISSAIDKADFVVAVLSHNSVSSNWVRKELQLAMSREIEGKRVRVLPVLIESCDIPDYLADKVYADFTDPCDFDRPLSKLLEAVGASYSRAASLQIRVRRCVADLLSTQVQDRIRGADMVAQIGPDAAEAVPHLIRALAADDAHLKGSAMKALGAIGPAAVSALPNIIDALLRTRTDGAISIVDVVLEGIQAKRIDIVRLLTRALSSEDREVRLRAMQLLEKLGSDAAESGSALFEILLNRREDADIRAAAASAVSSLPSRLECLRRSTPKLLAILLDPSGRSEMRYQISEIFRNGPDGVADDSLVSLFENLRNTVQPLLARQGISRLLRHIVPSRRNARVALPCLVEFISDESEDSEIRANAARALSRFGPRANSAVSPLLHCMRDPSLPVEFREDATLALGGIAGTRQEVMESLRNIVLDSGEPAALRKRALSVLANQLPDSLESISLIKDLLADRGRHHGFVKDVVFEIRSIGWHLESLGLLKQRDVFYVQIVPLLLEILSDESEDDFLRSSVADILGDTRDDTATVIEALRQACEGEPALSRSAMRALSKSDQGKELLAPIILDKIAKKEELSTCFGLLHDSGVSEAIAVPLLVEATSDESAYLREAAVEGLGNYGPGAARAVPSLLGLIATERERNPAKDGWPYTRLGSMFGADVYSVRTRIVETLGKIQVGSDEVIHTIIEEMNASDSWLPRRAIQALSNFAPDERRAIKPIVEALKHDDKEMRLSALEALGTFKEFAAGAIEDIEELSHAEDKEVSIKACVAVCRIDPRRPAPKALLASFLRCPDYRVRLSASNSLLEIEHMPEELVATLIEVVQSDGPHVAEALRTLGKLGPLAAGAVDSVLRTLDEMPHLAVVAIETLGSIGLLAQSAAPRLKEFLSDSPTSIQTAAREALRSIESA